MQRCNLTSRKPYLVFGSENSDLVARFEDAVRRAEAEMKCSADVIRLVAGRDFIRYMEKFEKFYGFSPAVAAATEFKMKQKRLWTETFVDADSLLARRFPESVIAHEFAHIRECYNRGYLLELAFVKHCPPDARNFASLFMMELEEVVADSLLPQEWRNCKNRAILQFAENHPAAPHPFFLAALKVATDLREKDEKLFRMLLSKNGCEWWVRFSFRMALQYFKYFYVKRGLRIEDVKVVERGVNRVVEKLLGLKNSCVVRMRRVQSLINEKYINSTELTNCKQINN